MATYSNKNGTSEADILNLTASGTYNAGTGDDTINIKGGSIVVYTDGGNNTISVTGGSGHQVKVAVKDADSDKQNGVEKLTINGGNCVEGYLGSGKDVIVLNTTNGKKSNGALSQLHGGIWGDTFTTNAGATGYQLYGDNGDDTFNIKGGNNIVFWGGANNDTFNVTGGTNLKLRGGDSADIYNISVAGVDMQLGYGNDTVNVTAGNNQTIKGNLGTNTINLKAGSGHVITADIDKALSKKKGFTDTQINNGEGIGYGVDKVYITGTASNVTANLGDGKDVVEISSGSGHQIYTEGWGDTIKLDGTVTASSIYSGAGDDTFQIAEGTSNHLEGDDGDDYFGFAGGSDNYAYGGQGSDFALLVGGDKNCFDGEEGDDYGAIGINATNSTIRGGKGNDRLSIAGGTGNHIAGDEGDDYLYVNGGTSVSAIGNDGNDTFVIEDGDDVYISGYEGNDHIYLAGGNKVDLYGGKGCDTYWINWDKMGNETCILDFTDTFTNNSDKLLIYGDTLNVNNFSFEFDESIAELRGAGKVLEIYNFRDKYLTSISFQNKTQAKTDTAKTYDIKTAYTRLGESTYSFGSSTMNAYATTGTVDSAFKQANLPDAVKVFGSN